MRLLAPIVKLVRHAREWRETRRAERELRCEPKPRLPYDHGFLKESYGYWMTRIEREEANGVRKRDFEQ